MEESVYFKIISVTIYSAQVVFVVDSKNICGNELPRTLWRLTADEWFFVLFGLEGIAGFIFCYEVGNVLVHAWPINDLTSSPEATLDTCMGSMNFFTNLFA